MKKEEYLNCIEQALKAYDKDYVDEIIRDYEEHFQDALAQGKSEEEICDSLGNPEDVIQEIQELLGEPSNGDHEVARPFTEVEQVPFQKFQQEWESSQEFEQQTFHKIRFQAGATDIKIILPWTDIFIFIQRIPLILNIWNIKSRKIPTMEEYVTDGTEIYRELIC